MHNTFCEFSQIAALDVIVCLQEDLPESRLADGVILQVKFVKALEGVRVCVHVQCVDRKIVRCQFERLKYLL